MIPPFSSPTISLETKNIINLNKNVDQLYRIVNLLDEKIEKLEKENQTLKNRLSIYSKMCSDNYEKCINDIDNMAYILHEKINDLIIDFNKLKIEEN